MFWHAEHPDRLLRESSEIEVLAGEVAWIRSKRWGLDDELRFKVDVDIVINDIIYEVELIYPHLFPDTPAFIRPRSSTTTVHWSIHQYGPGGTLCLEWGPDNWRSEITGAMLLRSAHRLLAAEAAMGSTPTVIPSRHRTTVGQTVRSHISRLVVTDRLREWLDQLAHESHGSLVTHNIYHGVADVFFISEVKPFGGEPIVLTDVPTGVTASVPIFALKGIGWVFKSARLTRSEEIGSLDSLLAVVHDAGFEEFALPNAEGSSATRAEYIFLLLGSANKARAYWYTSSNGGTFAECAIVGRAPADGQRIPPEHVGLSEKKVGIVGLGSVGSKVAVSLARSGVRKFVLIDDDLMLPENVCRHELDWIAVGVHKADAVKQAIAAVASGIDVTVRRLRIGGQESAESASTALDALAACDVVLDATANPVVWIQLAAIAKRRQRVLVWGELFAGGIGGLLVRSRPGKDPDPQTMRAGVYAFLAAQQPAPFALATTRYDVEGEDTPPLIAFDAEVSQFASIVTRFVLDALLERNPSQFPYSAYLFGFKREWVFTAPFDTHPISVALPAGDEARTPEEQTSNQQEATEFLCQLMTQRTDDHPRPAQ